MIIKLVPQNEINIEFENRVLGKIKSLSVDLSETPFWNPIPKVKLDLQINSMATFDTNQHKEIAITIINKLKRFKFINILKEDRT